MASLPEGTGRSLQAWAARSSWRLHVVLPGLAPGRFRVLRHSQARMEEFVAVVKAYKFFKR